MTRHRKARPEMHRRPVVLTSVLALAVVGGVVGIGTLAGEATAFTAHAPAAKIVAPAPRNTTPQAAAPSASPAATAPSAASAAPSASPSASAAANPSDSSGGDVARPAGNSAGGAPSDSAQAVAPTALGSTATAPVTPESSRVGVLFAGAVAPGNHPCTASVLHSSTKNLVLTAAHCIVTVDGLSFAPAYRDGQTPYGSWPVTKVYTTTGWSQGGDPDEDYAILQVGQYGGHDIEDVVGGNVLGLQASFSTVVRLYGYPGTSEEPLLCSNSTTRQDTYQRRIDCPSYASGTSGGPWIDTDTNEVVGVIGGYQQGGDTDDTSYSAYFDHTIDDLYQQAVAGSG